MDHSRYCLANALILLGSVGFLLGGAWVWPGAATILFILVGDLLFGRDERPRRPWAVPATRLVVQACIWRSPARELRALPLH